MRDITIREVDLGCIACDAEKTTRNAATAFVAGVLMGLVKDEFALCSGHLGGFKRAMAKIEAEGVGWKRRVVPPIGVDK